MYICFLRPFHVEAQPLQPGRFILSITEPRELESSGSAFSCATQMVDLYHACQHLCDLAAKLYPRIRQPRDTE